MRRNAARLGIRRAFAPEPFHAIGLWYEDFSQATDEELCYFRARLPDQFDAAPRFDETRTVEPLGRAAEWEAGDAPETFPFAV